MRLRVLDRHLLTLEAYLKGPLRGHFYRPEFLSGLAVQRSEVMDRQGKVARSVILIAAILVFFEASSLHMEIAGIDYEYSDSFRAPLTLLLAIGILVLFLTTLDQVILEQYIVGIGNSAGIFSFQIPMANLTARNLWADPLSPKYFGPRSSIGHIRAGKAAVAAVLLPVGVIVLFPILAVLISSVIVLSSDTSLIERVAAVVSLAILIASMVFAAVFFLKFEFDPAHFNEADQSPTEELLAELREKSSEASPL